MRLDLRFLLGTFLLASGGAAWAGVDVDLTFGPPVRTLAAPPEATAPEASDVAPAPTSEGTCADGGHSEAPDPEATYPALDRILGGTISPCGGGSGAIGSFWGPIEVHPLDASTSGLAFALAGLAVFGAGALGRARPPRRARTSEPRPGRWRRRFAARGR